MQHRAGKTQLRASRDKRELPTPALVWKHLGEAATV